MRSLVQVGTTGSMNDWVWASVTSVTPASRAALVAASASAGWLDSVCRRAMASAWPAAGAAPALAPGETDYLSVLRDVYQPLTRCLFTAE